MHRGYEKPAYRGRRCERACGSEDGAARLRLRLVAGMQRAAVPVQIRIGAWVVRGNRLQSLFRLAAGLGGGKWLTWFARALIAQSPGEYRVGGFESQAANSAL